MKKGKIIIIALLSLFSISEGWSQIVDTVDIMKEFDEHSFRNAQPIGEVKDSSRIREHLLGVKWGYAIDNIYFSVDYDKKSLMTPKNFGIYYTYYHSLWDAITLFGIETGLQFNEVGYTTTVLDDKGKVIKEGKERFQTVTLPFVSQFRIDFWNMRLLFNLGAYGSYKLSASFSDLLDPSISSTYKKYGYGIIGGGGVAFVFRPFEIHLEANYKYNLSNTYDPKVFYKDVWVSTHTSQIIISAGLHYRIGGSAYKNPQNKPTRKN
ncbi:MAG: outer membrane beta-barrel protein [Bacteroidales bacterium]|nr:outer membrane beta-barrel protein [Bacteroidales bacterium]